MTQGFSFNGVKGAFLVQQHTFWQSAYTGFVGFKRLVYTFFSQRVLRSGKRVLALLSLCVLISSMITTQGTPRAFAAAAKPQTDWSFYIYSTSTTTAYNLGCSQGKFDASFSPVVNSEVILSFGEQYNSDGSGGVVLLNNTVISNAQVEGLAEAFAHGYWYCTGSDSTSVLNLAIGTSNYGNATPASGKTWANDVAAVQASNRSNGYASQVGMLGAYDMESWCPNHCVTPSGAMAWESGFGSVSGGYKYLDYGSADGCPQTTASNGGCSGGWKQSDYWYLSWGATPALPVPEIYVTAQAQQWAMISLYGAQSQGARLYMQGPLDEYDLDTTTLTASQAWSYLWTNLNNNAATTDTPPYSLEIHND